MKSQAMDGHRLGTQEFSVSVWAMSPLTTWVRGFCYLSSLFLRYKMGRVDSGEWTQWSKDLMTRSLAVVKGRVPKRGVVIGVGWGDWESICACSEPGGSHNVCLDWSQPSSITDWPFLVKRNPSLFLLCSSLSPQPPPAKSKQRILPFGAKAAHVLGVSRRGSHFLHVPLSHRPVCQVPAVASTTEMALHSSVCCWTLRRSVIEREGSGKGLPGLWWQSQTEKNTRKFPQLCVLERSHREPAFSLLFTWMIVGAFTLPRHLCWSLRGSRKPTLPSLP